MSELLFKFRYRFEAAHRFTSSASAKCQTPHGHTWYATALFKLNQPRLDSAAMAAEFGETKRLWKQFITEVVDHSFMHFAGDPMVEAMRAHIPGVRLLPFPCDPTTEAIAGLFALKLRAMHSSQPTASGVRPVGVRIQETPTNAIDFRWPSDGSSPLWLEELTRGKTGWWSSAEPTARSL